MGSAGGARSAGSAGVAGREGAPPDSDLHTLVENIHTAVCIHILLATTTYISLYAKPGPRGPWSHDSPFPLPGTSAGSRSITDGF